MGNVRRRSPPKLLADTSALGPVWHLSVRSVFELGKPGHHAIVAATFRPYSE